MKKEVISTSKAPAAVGPYSQAIKVDNFIFTSGQIPFDPETNELVGEDIESQTRQVFKNVTAVLEAAGATLDDVVKTTMFIKNMDDFNTINKIYGEFFTENPPARSAVEAARLPKNVLIEVEVIAIK